MIYVNEKYLNYTATLCTEVKQASYGMAGITSDTNLTLDVLDVGCGIGVDTAKIAQKLSPDSKIVGVDSDPDMVQKAIEKVEKLGLGNVSHFFQEASALSFQEEFDVVRAERLFQHLEKPEIVFTKMIEATRRGGKIIIVDTDWSTLRCTLLEEDENKAIADKYSTQLTFGSNLNVFREFFREQNLQLIEDRVIGVKLDYQDYMTASKIKELLPGLYDEEKTSRIFSRLDEGSDLDIFGVIDIVVISGVKS